jgi:hypothetical protein
MTIARQQFGTGYLAILGMFLGFWPASALICGAAVLPSSGVNGQAPTTALVFYADRQASESLWPSLFQTLLQDLSADAGELPEGVVLDKQPAILRGSDDLRGISFQHIVSVKLLGRCELLPQEQRSPASGPLGWVLRVSGKVQPYIYIDCARLAQVLQPAAGRMSKQQRQFAMAQAISRVLIHEWVHIDTQSSAHSRRGLTQSNLSIDDLIGPADHNRLSATTR